MSLRELDWRRVMVARDVGATLAQAARYLEVAAGDAELDGTAEAQRRLVREQRALRLRVERALARLAEVFPS